MVRGHERDRQLEETRARDLDMLREQERNLLGADNQTSRGMSRASTLPEFALANGVRLARRALSVDFSVGSLFCFIAIGLQQQLLFLTPTQPLTSLCARVPLNCIQ